MVSKRERRRLRRMNQDQNDNSQKAQALQHNEPHQPEVFDSSKYDSMSEMTKSVSTDRLSDSPDPQKKEPLKPEGIDNKSLSANASTEAVISPMMAEERARTIRETSEVVQARTDQQTSDAIPEWNEAMMRQYMEMVNSGIELYTQFLKASLDFANSWFSPFRYRTE